MCEIQTEDRYMLDKSCTILIYLRNEMFKPFLLVEVRENYFEKSLNIYVINPSV